MPLYMIERTFAEQLDLTSDDVKLIEEINADEGVRWLFSFLSADRRRTYCLYEAPSPDAILAAARRANVPADAVVEVGPATPELLGPPARLGGRRSLELSTVAVSPAALTASDPAAELSRGWDARIRAPARRRYVIDALGAEGAGRSRTAGPLRARTRGATTAWCKALGLSGSVH